MEIIHWVDQYTLIHNNLRWPYANTVFPQVAVAQVNTK